MHKVWLALNLLFLTSCTFTLVTPQPSRATLIAGINCPVSELQRDVVSKSLPWSLVGNSPIWLLVNLDPKSKQTKAILNVGKEFTYPIGYRTVLITEEKLDGQLTLQGEQLDGAGIVRFPTSEESNSGKQFSDYSDTFILASAATTDADVPKGFNSHSLTVLYPNPGCYQFTATLKNKSDTYHSTFVIQLVEEP